MRLPGLPTPWHLGSVRLTPYRTTSGHGPSQRSCLQTYHAPFSPIRLASFFFLNTVQPSRPSKQPPSSVSAFGAPPFHDTDVTIAICDHRSLCLAGSANKRATTIQTRRTSLFVSSSPNGIPRSLFRTGTSYHCAAQNLAQPFAAVGSYYGGDLADLFVLLAYKRGHSEHRPFLYPG